MPIYQADDSFTQGIGKDVPAMGPFKNYSPKLMGPKIGPGGFIGGAISIGTHVYKNYKFYTKMFSALAGTGVSGGINGKGNSSQYKALQTRFAVQRRKRRGGKQNAHPVCCCCRQKRSKRSRRRMQY